MTTTETTRGFAVNCIRCNEEGTVRVDLHDTSSFSCSGCDEDFTADDVREHMAKWAKVLKWLATAPEME